MGFHSEFRYHFIMDYGFTILFASIRFLKYKENSIKRKSNSLKILKCIQYSPLNSLDNRSKFHPTNYIFMHIHTHSAFIHKHIITESIICHFQNECQKCFVITFSICLVWNQIKCNERKISYLNWIEKRVVAFILNILIAFALWLWFQLKIIWPFHNGYSNFQLQLLCVIYSQLCVWCIWSKTYSFVFWQIYSVVPKTNMFTRNSNSRLISLIQTWTSVSSIRHPICGWFGLFLL